MPSITRRALRAIAPILCVAAALSYACVAAAQPTGGADSAPRVYAPFVTAASVPSAALPPAPLPGDWLPRLNYERALAGVPPLGEDPALSAECREHAQVMAAAGQLSRRQDPASQPAAGAGQECAERASLWLAPGTLATPLDPIAAWVAAPEDRLWLLYPTASAAGFGLATDSGRQAAAMHVRAPQDPAADAAYVGWPVAYPGAGQIGVAPDRSPVTLLWPRSGPAPELTSTILRTASGDPIAHASSSDLPGGHRGVQIAPLASLPPRAAIVVEVSGSYAGAPFSLSWQFTTGEPPAPPTAGAPPPAPPAGR